MESKKRAILIAAFIAVIILLGLLIITRFGDESAGQRGQDSLVGVETALAERRDMRDLRVFTGTLIAEKQYDAAAKVGGQVMEIAVDLGDCIRKGDLIARLDNEEHLQQLAQAQAELDVAKASLAEARSTLEAAEREYNRIENLREQKVASASELDAARTQYEAQQAGLSLAEAQIAQREASLRAAEIRLSYTTIKAEWENGDDESCRYVAARYVNQGATISANTPVVTLVDLSLLKAVIHVAERDYAHLEVGQPATVTVDYMADKSFPGTVTRLAPVFDETSRQAQVEVKVPNPNNTLKAGMFANVHIELDEAKDTIAIPADALIQRGTQRGAFIVENGKVRFQPLAEGIRDKSWVEVDELKEGTEVVTLGHHLLSDGMTVTTTPRSQTTGEQRPRL